MSAVLPIDQKLSKRFVSSAQDQARLPVAFVTGFLGAGKTTLINALLSDPAMEGTAVAVNEFGAVALDQHLIARDEGDVLVLANGCLCCNLAGDAEAGMLQLFARRDAGDLPPFRRLLVEPSGLADPAPLAQAILRNPLMSRYMRLAGIVAVVDGLFGAQNLRNQPEAAKQVAMADRIVISKSDLVSPDMRDALQAELNARNPVAPHLLAAHGVVNWHDLFAPHFLDPEKPSGPDLPRRALFAEAVNPHAEATIALVLTHNAPLDWPRFEIWLRETRLRHAHPLLRLKGLVAVDQATGPLLIQGVHHVLHPPVQLAAWPDADHSTRLVLILRGTDPAPIRDNWAMLTQNS